MSKLKADLSSYRPANLPIELASTHTPESSAAVVAASNPGTMELMIMPPGAIATPHFHPKHETALYLLKGRVEVCYGQGLKQCQVCEAGDFVFTPPGVPHQPRNLSDTEPVYIVTARNDPDEQEKIVPYDPTLDR